MNKFINKNIISFTSKDPPKTAKMGNFVISSAVRNFILRFLSAVVVSSLLFDFFPYFCTNPPKTNLFTPEELSKYNGVDNKQLYLSILGNVFDVTRGAKYYGPGETYHTFVGRDNSQSFVTGEFRKVSDEVTSFNNQELRSLNHWVKFYKKDYIKIGKLIGRYYNEKGKLTPYGREVKLRIKRAEEASVNEDMEKIQFPPCNVEWDAKKGSRVWCTNKSGGISRNWVGVPRQYYEVGSKQYRCACISNENKHLGTIKAYEGCDEDAISCDIKN